MRVESKPAFTIIGRKTWISGQNNEEFGQFWAEAGNNGLLTLLGCIRGTKSCPVTGAEYLGLSAVERDPTDRRFDFYIAVESTASTGMSVPGQTLEKHGVPAAQWAIFRNRGHMPDALIEAEMWAFTQWLPASGFRHAAAPELEVYPPDDAVGGVLVEFWLPIVLAE
jgi:AraC family transcriptional regulator